MGCGGGLGYFGFQFVVKMGLGVIGVDVVDELLCVLGEIEEILCQKEGFFVRIVDVRIL